ncbi:hypothetical protein [Tsuneonella amylolytica]|uniref:hypothetical protein n=1 Tax=Tsuneonella amylolytica TaxID=2338327 RepID=UPI000EAA921B|nr:hypothetical protein [Tsuneonella amylolytica]
MRGPTPYLAPLLAFALSGCIASTLVDVATAPVKVASKAVDLATTSQSEADEKRGRELRKREQRLGELQRQRDKLEKKCISDRDHRACDELSAVNAEIKVMLPQVPYAPGR